ncbi:hypothetical protein L1987_31483 [Smallanthus sonchifolius]|uniref:Uncharacterized protein n=1 Tax=Smallanthus sonchifolius TaxID=185202 RepID=A0ACB9I522_9ASTR|nr:hypothetical protein L1987_31483 [Smallanthus sonchifolius]
MNRAVPFPSIHVRKPPATVFNVPCICVSFTFDSTGDRFDSSGDSDLHLLLAKLGLEILDCFTWNNWIRKQHKHLIPKATAK